MKREIAKAFQGIPAVQDSAMTLFRALPTNQIESLGPFVFVDFYETKGTKGIGDSPHPHAGIEVISYLLQGESVHRDSLGNTDTLTDGDAQFIKAGQGIIHKETPRRSRKGLQLWTSLPPKQKFEEAEYYSYKANTIPTFKLDENEIKVIAGEISGHKGILPTARPTVLVHIHFENSNEINLPIDANWELGVYVINGQVMVAEKGPLQIGDLALLTEGDEIKLQAFGDLPVDIVLLGGEKIDYPLVFDGPFVMDSKENLAMAYQNYKTGKMGSLDGIPF
ncbi:MAG: pirin family protein [Saprospiraceae bacterium]|nr:pirin family protein [Saprospiraceae bacterium]